MLWVPGGHSWMLARPQGQADILTHGARGREFMEHVDDRRRQLADRAQASPKRPCLPGAGCTGTLRRQLSRRAATRPPLPSWRAPHHDQPPPPAAAPLHGWQAYALVGLLVFAKTRMVRVRAPGETAAVLGAASPAQGGVDGIGGIVAVVVVCAIVGDSVGYAIGDRWGRQLYSSAHCAAGRRASPRPSSN